MSRSVHASYYLVAQLQAPAANLGFTGRCHACDLIAVFPAETALSCSGLIADLLNRGDGRACRPVGFAYHCARTAHATVADVHARSGDDFLDLLPAFPAERARHMVFRFGHSLKVLGQRH